MSSQQIAMLRIRNAITSLVDCSGAQRVEWPAAIAGNDGSTACPDSGFPRYQARWKFLGQEKGVRE
jgi:hypothetical protein